MGRPAARLGDATVHGGVIVAGMPTVLIGGQPAARIGDMHTCPLVNPGPVPHVGGPVVMGSPTVFIGGTPAARQGDILVCTGPPDSVAIGFPTVLIGEAGAGGGGDSGGGGGGGDAVTAAAAAAASAHIALSPGQPGTSDQDPHWIEFRFVDKAGNPVGQVHFEFTAPDQRKTEGRLGDDGMVKWTGPTAGEGAVKLMSLTNARWSQEEARLGDTVTLSAEVEGYDPGTQAKFHIYERDVGGADDLIASLEAETLADRVMTTWEYEYTEDRDDVLTDEEIRSGYSAPEYYFEVVVGRSRTRSSLLKFKDYIEIELKNTDDDPMAHENFIVMLPNGQIRVGILNGDGYARVDHIPPGYCRVLFPGLPEDGSD